MINKLALGLLAVGMISASSYAALNASDKASNSPYQPGNVWNPCDNGGTSFGVWSFTATGAGGHFISLTGETGDLSFGVFAGGTAATDLSLVTRPFTSLHRHPGRYEANVQWTIPLTAQ